MTTASTVGSEILRPVSYCGWGAQSNQEFFGRFHGWASEGCSTESGGIQPVAIVELENGEVRLPYAARVKFLDVTGE